MEPVGRSYDEIISSNNHRGHIDQSLEAYILETGSEGHQSIGQQRSPMCIRSWGRQYPVFRKCAWFSLKNLMLYEHGALSPVCFVFDTWAPAPCVQHRWSNANSSADVVEFFCLTHFQVN